MKPPFQTRLIFMKRQENKQVDDVRLIDINLLVEALDPIKCDNFMD